MTPRPAIASFESPDALARSAAEQFAQKLLAAGQRPLNIGLPGGRIYSLFFSCLADEARRHPGILDNARFFWGDERCVPPEHPESNFRLAKQSLFDPLQIPHERVFRIQGETKPDTAAELAEKQIRSLVPLLNDVPALDYVFLGMGEDGHVASLFPGEAPEQITSKAVYRAVVGPKPPPDRVTLGYAALWAAKNLWVLVSGSGKSGALKQSLSPGGATPLARVLSRRDQALIFTDCGL